MKLFLLFISIVTVYSHAVRPYLEVPEAVAGIIRASVKKCAPNPEDVEELIRLVNRGHYREDPSFRNIIHCSYKNSGFADEDGTIRIEAASAVFLGNEVFHKAMKNCDVKGPTAIETTFLSFKCYKDTSPYLLKI